MNWDHDAKWLITLHLVLLSFPTANLQMPMQVFQMPSAFGYAAPAPIAFQLVEIRERKTTTTTTTENPEKTIGIAIPVAFPLPVQFAVPAYPPPNTCSRTPRPINCPVCPPCSCTPCTPSFFSYCSPCHHKCRCHSSQDTPIPLPRGPPVAMPGPAFAMPVPMGNVPNLPLVPVHSFRRNTDWNADAYGAGDPGSSSGEWISRKRRRSTHGGKQRHFRKRKIHHRQLGDMDDMDFAKPVLSYLSNDGIVQLEHRLSNDEAAELIEDNKVQKVQLITDVEPDNKHRLKVISDPGVYNRQQGGEHHRKQVFLNAGNGQHMLSEGRKELIFNPPSDKRISNLSVSFQIS